MSRVSKVTIDLLQIASIFVTRVGEARSTTWIILGSVRAAPEYAQVRAVHPIAHLARRLISDDPARTCDQPSRDASAYSHWAAWPSAPDPNRVALHTRTTPLPNYRHARWKPGPTHIHRADTPHGPVLGPRFRISTRAAPQRRTAPRRHRAPRQPQHLSAQRHRSTLLCTAHLPGLLMHLSAPPHCTSLYAPCAWRSAYCGSTHSPKVTSCVMECLPERPHSVPLRRQERCGCSKAGWRSSVPAREHVRSG